MTAAAARTLWREYVNETDSTNGPSDTRVDYYLDSGLEALNQRVKAVIADDTSTVTIVNGTQEYTLPTTCVEVVWVEWNGKILDKKDMDEFRRRYVEWRNTPTGFPREYAVYGRKLVLHPAPNADAVAAAANPRIRMVKLPAGIAASGLVDFCDQHHRIAVYYGAGLWFISANGGFQAELAKPWFDLFNAEAQAAAGQYFGRALNP